jgi:hypothetical protein
MATVASKNVSWGGIDNTPWGLTAKVGPYKATVQDKLNFFNRQGGPNAGHANAFYTIRPGVFTETKQPKTMGYYTDNSIIDNYDYSVQSNIPGRKGKKMSFKDNFNIQAHNERIAIHLKGIKDAQNAERALEMYREEFRNFHMQNMSAALSNARARTDTRNSIISTERYGSNPPPSSSSGTSPLNPGPDNTFRPEASRRTSDASFQSANSAMSIESPESLGEAMEIDDPPRGYGYRLLYNPNARGAKRGLLPEALPENTDLGNIIL